MVIYWFGFIEELDNNRDKGIIVCDHFPDNIVFYDPLKEESSSSEDSNNDE